ncbi:hypothetical protein, partial [Pseudomonas viridiflava]|uniref:hypothetical protein n=1 Tax=Pseudomonas viridiflava TaxID=33069 RepID=UPI001CA8100D
EDERLRILGERLIYQEAPQVLKPDQKHRVLSNYTFRTECTPDGLLTREGALGNINELRGQAPMHYIALLDEYRAYLVQIR